MQWKSMFPATTFFTNLSAKFYKSFLQLHGKYEEQLIKSRNKQLLRRLRHLTLPITGMQSSGEGFMSSQREMSYRVFSPQGHFDRWWQTGLLCEYDGGAFQAPIQRPCLFISIREIQVCHRNLWKSVDPRGPWNNLLQLHWLEHNETQGRLATCVHQKTGDKNIASDPGVLQTIELKFWQGAGMSRKVCSKLLSLTIAAAVVLI